MNPPLRVLILALAGVALSGAGFLLLSDLGISYAAQGRLFDEVSAVPQAPVALVLGTSKEVSDGRENLFFRYRMDAAAELFHEGKVRHLLVSGDNGVAGYDEPSDMKAALVQRGVPEAAITMDYAGFRTLDSIVRCKEVFQQQHIVIVSQPFHNERALFLASAKGLDAVAFNAQAVSGRYGLKTRLREVAARGVAVLDVTVFHRRPRFLGKKEEIVFHAENN